MDLIKFNVKLDPFSSCKPITLKLEISQKIEQFKSHFIHFEYWQDINYKSNAKKTEF